MIQKDMGSQSIHHRFGELPLAPVPQMVPSKVCLTCEVCCRFPEIDSFLRPYFTAHEIRHARDRGIADSFFPNPNGCQVEVVPHPTGDGYLCPAFDPETFRCRIYEVRPLDCQIYPFVVMWDQKHQTVLIGWDSKCPFVINQISGENPQVSQDANRRRHPDPPDGMLEVAKVMAQRLESEELIETLGANPQLVTRFQDDVVVIQKLPRLTQQLVSSKE